jgi:hypothetical protein
MSSAPRRTLTGIILAGYLFSVTAAGLFHRHGYPAHGAAAPVCESGVLTQSPSVAGAACCDEDGCPVCRFLAHKTVPVRIADAPVWTGLSGELPRVRRACAVAGATPFERSRDPPSVA